MPFRVFDLKYRLGQEVLEVSAVRKRSLRVQEMKVLLRKIGHLGRLVDLNVRYLGTNFYSVFSVEYQQNKKDS